MKIKELIKKLEKYESELPICINDDVEYADTSDEGIKIERKSYIFFPFDDEDRFEYVNLSSKKV